MARMASGLSMSARRQAFSHGRGADVAADGRHRVRVAGQDVALFEASLGGQHQVAAAIRVDRAAFLALDVALEPVDADFGGLEPQRDCGLTDHGRGRTAGSTRNPMRAKQRLTDATRPRFERQSDGSCGGRRLGCATACPTPHRSGRSSVDITWRTSGAASEPPVASGTWTRTVATEMRGSLAGAMAGNQASGFGRAGLGRAALAGHRDAVAGEGAGRRCRRSR